MNTATHDHRCGMDKRKVACFLLLVLIGLSCVAAMLYMLFYAKVHGTDEIRHTGRSAICMPAGRGASGYLAAAVGPLPS